MSNIEKIISAFRETAWIAFCYNDHNFSPSVLKDKAKTVCALLGINSIEDANKVLESNFIDDTQTELPPMSEVNELLITKEDFNRIIKQSREYSLENNGMGFDIDFHYSLKDLWKDLRDER